MTDHFQEHSGQTTSGRRVALRFPAREHAARLRATRDQMARQGIDALLVFAQESHYYLTGYDTAGYVFFQVGIITADDRPTILLTRRPARMGRHAGQYALPGGKVDPGETSEQAAFRELSEELGLDLPPEALLGRLDDYATRSGFRISPFVVWAGASPEITPQPDEVAAVLRDAVAGLPNPVAFGNYLFDRQFPALTVSAFHQHRGITSRHAWARSVGTGVGADTAGTVSYTHLTLPTKRIV